jgi:hypothetical protein
MRLPAGVGAERAQHRRELGEMRQRPPARDLVARRAEIDVNRYSQERPGIGRDSSFVRSMPRSANTLSALNSEPGSLGSVKTIVVLSATLLRIGLRPTTRKRVVLSSKSWTEAASDVRPNTSPAFADAIAPASVRPASATILALPAVS